MTTSDGLIVTGDYDDAKGVRGLSAASFCLRDSRSLIDDGRHDVAVWMETATLWSSSSVTAAGRDLECPTPIGPWYGRLW